MRQDLHEHHAGDRAPAGPAVDRWLAEYPLGVEVTVHDDPDHPAIAYIKTGLDRSDHVGSAGIAAASSVGGLGLLAFWVIPRWRRYLA